MAEAVGSLKVLECTLCTKGYSQQDVEKGLFYASTGVCLDCYKQGQLSHRKVWCFGKETLYRKGKLVVKAFDNTAPECQLHCPDRVICAEFIKKKKEQHVKER